jgi:hypothetical protein
MRRRPPRHLPAVLLFALAVAGLLLQTGSVPHLHLEPGVGLYNHEHDLGSLAAYGTGVVSDGPSATPLGVAVLLSIGIGVTRPASTPRRHADVRAPPAR